MTTSSPTIYKVYTTLKAAESYIARNLAHDAGVAIEVIDSRFFVIAR